MLLAVIVGSVVIIISSFIATGELDLMLPLRAYWSLMEGSLGNVNAIVNSIVQAAPLALGGLAVGVGFKAGLFNIGVQGQFLLGALARAAVGAILHTEPFFISMPASIIAGVLVGGLYGAIPGVLKAATGAHEVVTTIMLNYVAASILGYLVIGPLAAPGYSFARTGEIGSAALPILFGRNLHAGIFLAFALVPVMWWLLYRTTLGFQIRTVGANPSAARYAGMLPGRMIVLTMALSGSARRSCRRTRDPRHQWLHLDWLRNIARLRCDHRCPAGAKPPVRHPARGPAVRGAQGRRRIDADPGWHPAGDRRRDPGPDPALPDGRDNDSPLVPYSPQQRPRR